MKPLTGYIFLFIAISCGITANSLAKISDGFTKLTPSVACILLMCVTMFSLAKGMSAIPVGFVGPLKLNGREYNIPLATTEGALLASTNRGCRAITQSGGASSFVFNDGMTRAPVLLLPSAQRACEMKAWIDSPDNFAKIKCAASMTFDQKSNPNFQADLTANMSEAMQTNVCKDQETKSQLVLSLAAHTANSSSVDDVVGAAGDALEGCIDGVMPWKSMFGGSDSTVSLTNEQITNELEANMKKQKLSLLLMIQGLMK